MPRPIVLVAGKDPEEGIGGHSRYVRAHGRAAIRAGFEPHIFCTGRRRETVKTDFGILHRVSSWRGRLFPTPLAMKSREHLMVWRVWALAAAVEGFVGPHRGPHLVHGFGVWGWVAVAVSRRLRRRGREAIPVVSAYDTWKRETRAKRQALGPGHGLGQRLGAWTDAVWAALVVDRMERVAYGGARLVLGNYESVRRLLAESYGIGPTFRKVPYASETAFLADERVERSVPVSRAIRGKDRPLVVAVARHDPRKGLDVLLQALARLRAEGLLFRACLVGGGDLLDTHRRLALRLGIGDLVAIEGFVPDPRPYLLRADVFVLPTLHEGSGSLALLEALQAGVAVVASEVDGIPEDVEHGDSALLVPPGDTAALAAALGRVLTDPGLRTRLAARARATFELRFSAEILSTTLRDVYAELGVAPSDGGG